MWVMYDSVTTGQIPQSAPAVAGYVGGNWPTYSGLEQRWPHAKHLSIAVNAGEDAECLDVENGDATPADCPGWYHRQIARGVVKPVFYCSAGVAASVIDTLIVAGIPRDRYRLWTAHYTFVAHLCGPKCGVPTDADATQWTDRAAGRNLDESLCTDGFFSPAAPAAGKPTIDVLEPLERLLADRLLVDRRHPYMHRQALARTHALLVVKRKQVWAAAQRDIERGVPHADAWHTRNRGARYLVLQELTR